MAGIGFVLRKLASREDLSSLASGFLLSAIVAAGPWLLTTVGLLVVSYSSMGTFPRVRDYLLFRSLVTFSFALSLLAVSFLQLPATRFVADRFFEQRFSENRAIYLTSLLLTLALGVPLSLLCVFSLRLPPGTALAFFNLLVVLMLLWITTAFVSTLRDYRSVGLAFVAGVGTSVAGTLFGARHGGVAGALWGYLLGEGLIVALLAARIAVEFPGPVGVSRRFLGFLRRRGRLMLLGAVMTMGIWIDKILFWYGPGGEQIRGFVHANRLYDIGMFFALLTIIPTLALFVFFFETGFYERYRGVFALLEGRRPFSEVLLAKERMVAFIRQGLGYILKIQGAVTFVAVLNAHGLLSLFHADLLALPIFRMGALGGFCQVIVTLEITLLLYFNQHRMVERLSWILLLLNGGLTLLFWAVSPRLEGFGYLAACLVSAVYGYRLLDRGVIDFEFIVFMTPPEAPETGGAGEGGAEPGTAARAPKKGIGPGGRGGAGVLAGLLLPLLVWTLFFPASARAEPGAANWKSLSRHCLVLYVGPEGETDDRNNFRAYWEFPLNFLGFDAVYRNMEGGFPDPATLGGYRAVFLQIDRNPLPDSAGFWRFLDGLLDRKIPFAILEDFPERRKGDPLFAEAGEIRQKVLRRMGLRREGVWDTAPFDLSWGHRDRRMEGFEYPLPSTPQAFRPLESVSPANRVFLGTKSSEFRNRGEESVYGVLGPWGGMVLDPYMIRWPSLDATHTLWYVDPFRFLEAVLSARRTPRMDLATLDGNRIFYSQVDGDAFETLSRYRRRRMSAEVLYRAIFRSYPLPFSVSVITSQIDPKVQGSESRVYWARRIFALPNVEAGSHTYSHPFYWSPTKKQKDEGPVHIAIPHYRLDMKTEIDGSIDYIDRHLLPPGKKVALLQWSGDTRPGTDALRRLSKLGVANINGSDTRFDNDAPSYTFVFPYFRRVGPFLQYFNSDVNDYILTNDWRGPYFGFLNVIETFRKTDRPRRVDPVDVYFHFYAGQRESALNALRQVLDWARRKPLAPMFASGFVRVEDGYIRARIETGRDREGTLYRISGYGADTTVRFDHAATLWPDPVRSTGVIGWRHRLGALYLYLAPGGKTAVIGLSRRRPSGVRLFRATGYVRLRGRPSPREVDFVYDGWESEDRVVWSGLSPSAPYRLMREGNEGRGGMSAMAGPDGRLALDRLKPGIVYRLVRK